MIEDFFSGFGIALSGFGLLMKKGITRFVIVPFLINLLVFSGALWTGFRAFERLIDTLTRWTPSWLDWLQWLIWPLAIMMVLIMVYYTFTLVANLIAAPFNALLAERAEAVLRGQADLTGQDYRKIPAMVARTIWSEIRKLLHQLKWLVGLLILSFIPGLNILAPFGWIYFGAWMLAVNYADYPMGNHDLYFTAVKTTLKADRVCALGFGLGLMLITLIPVVNFVAMPVGVVSASAYWVKRLSRDTPISPHHQA